MRVGVVLAAGLAAVAVALVVLLAQSDRRQAGSNYVIESAEVAKLRGRAEHCQDGALIPADASALKLLVGTYGEPTPALRVTVRQDGTLVSSGALPAGRRQGTLIVPLRRSIDDTIGATQVCIATGPGRRVVLYGQSGLVRLEWLRPGRETWAALTPTIAHRFGLGKALTGSWLIVLAAALLLAGWAVAVRLVLRELRP